MQEVQRPSDSINQVLDQQEHFVAKLSGYSMYPLLQDGDLIEVQKSEQLRRGDIVLFRFHEMLVAHRILNATESHITAKGDALKTIETIERSRVLGKVISFRRKERIVSTGSFW